MNISQGTNKNKKKRLVLRFQELLDLEYFQVKLYHKNERMENLKLPNCSH